MHPWTDRQKNRFNIFISILGNLYPLNQMQLSKYSNWLYFLNIWNFHFPKKIRKTAMSAVFWPKWIRCGIFISILDDICPLNPMQFSKFSDWLFFIYSKFTIFLNPKNGYVSWFLTEIKRCCTLKWILFHPNMYSNHIAWTMLIVFHLLWLEKWPKLCVKCFRTWWKIQFWISQKLEPILKNWLQIWNQQIRNIYNQLKKPRQKKICLSTSSILPTVIGCKY